MPFFSHPSLSPPPSSCPAYCKRKGLNSFFQFNSILNFTNMLRPLSLARHCSLIVANGKKFYSTGGIGSGSGSSSGGGGGGSAGHSDSNSSSGRRLEGKVALITGGASGLGKATAHHFIKHGARVIIADVDSKLGLQTQHELGPQAHFVPCDVTHECQVAEAVQTAVARHGKLDIMYNNAGITGHSIPPSIADLDLEEFDRVMRVNVGGTIAGIKHAGRVMIPAGSGSILCTSSISGLMGGLGPHPYTISKFTIPGIVKSLASELCQRGVRINCISPAPIPTKMCIKGISQVFPAATTEKVIDMINGLGELKGARCEDIDVARAALFLASDEAKYVTGHNLVVDGGFTCFKNLNFPSPDQFL